MKPWMRSPTATAASFRPRAVVSDAHSQEAAASSNGFSAVSAASLCWLGSQVTLRDQAQRRAEASFYAGARHLSDLPDAEQVARQALGRAVLRLGADKGPTQRTHMVVDPSAATALVQPSAERRHRP